MKVVVLSVGKVNMIKQSFLDSIKGLELVTAEKLCELHGYKTRVMEHGVASIMLAFPDTVELWLDETNTKVATASAGDGLELEKDE